MNLLVTGASGFTGRHLLRELGLEPETSLAIFSLYRSREPQVLLNSTNIRCDLTDYGQISKIIEDVRPDGIIHLAALNRGPLDALLTQNVVSTGNLFEAIHQAELSPRVIVAGSSAEYGYQGRIPIDENAPLRPMSLYGVSKAASSNLVLFYHRRYQIPTAIVRPFNLIGPGQSEDYLVGRLIAQMRQYDRGEIDSITLRNVDSGRDFIDVRDVVKAYLAILLHPDFDEVCSGKAFNVGSGRSTSVLSVFRILETMRGKEDPYELVTGPEPELIPDQVCDSGLIRRTVGWTPEITLESSLRDMVDLI